MVFFLFLFSCMVDLYQKMIKLLVCGILKSVHALQGNVSCFTCSLFDSISNTWISEESWCNKDHLMRYY